jgi:hypothetical protein
MIQILRGFEKGPILAGKMDEVPEFHGLVWHSGQEDPNVWEKVEEFQKRKMLPWWLYTQYLTHPEPEWIGSGDLWIDFVATLPKLEAPDGGDAVAWAYGRPMIDFHLLDTGKLHALHQTLQARIRKFTVQIFSQGIQLPPKSFLDLAFKRPREWMFLPEGPTYRDFPADWWVHWERRFLRSLKNQFEPLLNGDWSITGFPLYLEHSQNDFDRAFQLWESNPNHILSCLAEDRDAVSYMIKRVATVDSNIDRWIAFSAYTETAEDEAYEKAAETFGE